MSVMACPNCGHKDNKTLETREHSTYNWVRRRRHCNVCDNRWNTMEMPEDDFEIGALE